MNTSSAPRQLILLCDGTNNNLTGGHADTNVVKLCELLKAASPDGRRLLHYDPGVGHAGGLPGATGWDRLKRRMERLAGLAFGGGVYENMAESYLFLMRNYQPGDQIFIFGFSRGAFTARSIAGLVNQFGVLQSHMESMLPTLLHVYFADRGDRRRWDEISAQAARLFTDEREREVDIEFVGVWDTVASVGMWPFGAKFSALPKPEGKGFIHVRQALALDEHRLQFMPRLYARDNGPFMSRSGREGSLVQLWFPGAHCDVGGGYPPPDAALSDAALAWLTSEAVLCGLRLDDGAGRALDSEALLMRRLSEIAEPVLPTGRRLLAHSELCRTPWWALSGMSVRDTTRVVMDNGDQMVLQPQAHTPAPACVVDSCWSGARTPVLFWYSLGLLPLIVLALGQLLYGAPDTGPLSGDLRESLDKVLAYLGSNADFQRWQLSFWQFGQGAQNFASPRWALFWDLGLIVCYSIPFSWLAARAFAKKVGRRHAGDGDRPGLNKLGLALPLAVFADLGENFCGLLCITASVNQVELLAGLLHLLMAICSLLKWLGLAGLLVLVSGIGLPTLRSEPMAVAQPRR